MYLEQKSNTFGKKREGKEEGKQKGTRPSRPIRCDVWIVERMRYRPTNRPTDGHSQLCRCFVAPKKEPDLIGKIEIF